MKRLSVEQVCRIHGMMIRETGGLDGIRDQGLLASALSAPFQTFDDTSLYPTIEAKAAQLGFSLVRNHPFVDGNKRTGMMVMLLFLELNGVEGICSDEEIVRIGLGLAEGMIDYQSLLRWILD